MDNDGLHHVAPEDKYLVPTRTVNKDNCKTNVNDAATSLDSAGAKAVSVMTYVRGTEPLPSFTYHYAAQFVRGEEDNDRAM